MLKVKMITSTVSPQLELYVNETLREADELCLPDPKIIFTMASFGTGVMHCAMLIFDLQQMSIGQFQKLSTFDAPV